MKTTDAELAILKVLWEKQPTTVRDVHETLNKTRSTAVGYTTTLKMMQVMTEKGMLERDTSQKTHLYQTKISQEEAQQKLVDKLLDNVFGGSAMQLVMQALGNKKTSKKELKKIKNLITEIEKKEEDK